MYDDLKRARRRLTKTYIYAPHASTAKAILTQQCNAKTRIWRDSYHKARHLGGWGESVVGSAQCTDRKHVCTRSDVLHLTHTIHPLAWLKRRIASRLAIASLLKGLHCDADVSLQHLIHPQGTNQLEPDLTIDYSTEGQTDSTSVFLEDAVGVAQDTKDLERILTAMGAFNNSLHTKRETQEQEEVSAALNKEEEFCEMEPSDEETIEYLSYDQCYEFEDFANSNQRSSIASRSFDWTYQDIDNDLICESKFCQEGEQRTCIQNDFLQSTRLDDTNPQLRVFSDFNDVVPLRENPAQIGDDMPYTGSESFTTSISSEHVEELLPSKHALSEYASQKDQNNITSESWESIQDVYPEFNYANLDCQGNGLFREDFHLTDCNKSYTDEHGLRKIYAESTERCNLSTGGFDVLIPRITHCKNKRSSFHEEYLSTDDLKSSNCIGGDCGTSSNHYDSFHGGDSVNVIADGNGDENECGSGSSGDGGGDGDGFSKDDEGFKNSVSHEDAFCDRNDVSSRVAGGVARPRHWSAPHERLARITYKTQPSETRDTATPIFVFPSALSPFRNMTTSKMIPLDFNLNAVYKMNSQEYHNVVNVPKGPCGERGTFALSSDMSEGCVSQASLGHLNAESEEDSGKKAKAVYHVSDGAGKSSNIPLDISRLHKPLTMAAEKRSQDHVQNPQLGLHRSIPLLTTVYSSLVAPIRPCVLIGSSVAILTSALALGTTETTHLFTLVWEVAIHIALVMLLLIIALVALEANNLTESVLKRLQWLTKGTDTLLESQAPPSHQGLSRMKYVAQELPSSPEPDVFSESTSGPDAGLESSSEKEDDCPCTEEEPTTAPPPPPPSHPLSSPQLGITKRYPAVVCVDASTATELEHGEMSPHVDLDSHRSFAQTMTDLIDFESSSTQTEGADVDESATHLGSRVMELTPRLTPHVTTDVSIQVEIDARKVYQRTEALQVKHQWLLKQLKRKFLAIRRRCQMEARNLKHDDLRKNDFLSKLQLSIPNLQRHKSLLMAERAMVENQFEEEKKKNRELVGRLTKLNQQFYRLGQTQQPPMHWHQLYQPQIYSSPSCGSAASGQFRQPHKPNSFNFGNSSKTQQPKFQNQGHQTQAQISANPSLNPAGRLANQQQQLQQQQHHQQQQQQQQLLQQQRLPIFQLFNKSLCQQPQHPDICSSQLQHQQQPQQQQQQQLQQQQQKVFHQQQQNLVQQQLIQRQKLANSLQHIDHAGQNKTIQVPHGPMSASVGAQPTSSNSSNNNNQRASGSCANTNDKEENGEKKNNTKNTSDKCNEDA